MKLKVGQIREYHKKGKLRLLWYWCIVGKVMTKMYGRGTKKDIVSALVDYGLSKSTAYRVVDTLIAEKILLEKKCRGEIIYQLKSRHRAAPRNLYGQQKIKINEDQCKTYRDFAKAVATAIVNKVASKFRRQCIKVKGIWYVSLKTLAKWYGGSKTWWSRSLSDVDKEIVYSWSMRCNLSDAIWLVRQAKNNGGYLKITRAPGGYDVMEPIGFRPIIQ